MTKIFKLPAIFLFFTLASTNLVAQSIFNRDSLMNTFLTLKDEMHSNAIIAGVWRGDEEIVTIALGESMTDVPADVSMTVRIGGISEIFLGTLVLKLSDQGKINLDDKISKWLPDLLAADKITLRMLMNCTSGYKDYVRNKDFLDIITKHPFQNVSNDQIISIATSDGKLNFTPGTDQGYSHSDFTILGKCIEKATNKTMAELYEENIFKPLGLEHTGYMLTPSLPFPVLHSFSSDRGIYEDATYWNPSWTGDSGPLYSTLGDIYKFARAFSSGKLLTSSSFKELSAIPAGAKNPDLYYAYGFVVNKGWYWQNPSFNGYSGAFAYMPSNDLTIIIFATQSPASKSSEIAFDVLKAVTNKYLPESAIGH